MVISIEDHFRPRLAPRWSVSQVGAGQLLVRDEGLRLLVPQTTDRQYANAQIDDYLGLSRRRFPWRPPLRLTVRTRVSGALRGTAGFGFWNHPFSPLGEWPALPAAIWVFHASPPSDMPLALGVPGHGWKVACIDTTRPRALAWAPLAPPVVLLNQLPALYRRVWPLVQRGLCIHELPIAPLDTDWQTYTLEWREHSVRFVNNNVTIFEIGQSPRGPLGFVAWVDNQWMRVSPQGRFGWGLLEIVRPQWMDLDFVRIEQIGN